MSVLRTLLIHTNRMQTMLKTFAVLGIALASVLPVDALPTTEPPKGWIALFDGKTTNGWHSYGKTTTGAAWKVEDGTLHLDASNKADWQSQGGGDIVTAESFENFHLKVEWKIAVNGNSGIIFWVQDEPKMYPYVWQTGPEMQVLDDNGHADAKIHKHRAGDLYDLIAGTPGAAKPAGEWNAAEIISKNGKLTFVLNGKKILQTKYGDDNWNQLIAGSKFKEMPAFGKKFSGHIALQDHGDDVWFRNVLLKKL